MSFSHRKENLIRQLRKSILHVKIIKTETMWFFDSIRSSAHSRAFCSNEEEGALRISGDVYYSTTRQKYLFLAVRLYPLNILITPEKIIRKAAQT